MFWYLAKVAVSDGSVEPGSGDHVRFGSGHAEDFICPIQEVYPQGRVLRAVCYDLDDLTCLCKWEGTPPMDWTRLTVPEARTHFMSKKGFESQGVN